MIDESQYTLAVVDMYDKLVDAVAKHDHEIDALEREANRLQKILDLTERNRPKRKEDVWKLNARIDREKREWQRREKELTEQISAARSEALCDANGSQKNETVIKSLHYDIERLKETCANIEVEASEVKHRIDALRSENSIERAEFQKSLVLGETNDIIRRIARAYNGLNEFQKIRDHLFTLWEQMNIVLQKCAPAFARQWPMLFEELGSAPNILDRINRLIKRYSSQSAQQVDSVAQRHRSIHEEQMRQVKTVAELEDALGVIGGHVDRIKSSIRSEERRLDVNAKQLEAWAELAFFLHQQYSAVNAQLKAGIIQIGTLDSDGQLVVIDLLQHWIIETDFGKVRRLFYLLQENFPADGINDKGQSALAL